MALTRDYKETVVARLKRDLVHAEITFKELARQTGLGEKTLHRMLNRDRWLPSKATGFQEPEEGVSADCRRNAPDAAGHEITTLAPCCPIRSTGNGLMPTWPST